jgi:hypothetical protein
MSQEVPDLSERLLSAALAVKNLPSRESPEFVDFVRDLPDPVLGASLLKGARLLPETVEKIRSFRARLKVIWQTIVALVKMDSKMPSPATTSQNTGLQAHPISQLLTCEKLFHAAP